MLMMEKPLEVSAAIEQALVSWAGRQKSRLSKDD
jgi:hypothetical protein